MVLPLPWPEELFRSGIQGRPMLSTGVRIRGADGSKIVGGTGSSCSRFCGMVGLRSWMEDLGGRFPCLGGRESWPVPLPFPPFGLWPRRISSKAAGAEKIGGGSGLGRHRSRLGPGWLVAKSSNAEITAPCVRKETTRGPLASAPRFCVSKWMGAPLAEEGKIRAGVNNW